MPTTTSASQLMTTNYQDWAIDPSWHTLVDSFFKSNDGEQLLSFLQKRINEQAVIFPPTPLMTLQLTSLSDVRVIILGQDPYHQRGQAEGLAFSVAPGIALPPSLRNIFKEMQRDLGVPIPSFPQPGGSLVNWAKHGVLLLNTCLTVEEGRPASHTKRGWEILTDAIIKEVNKSTRPLVFMLWGAHAQSKKILIDSKKHLILCANHPSPLSALRPPQPFIGCDHFSKAKQWQIALEKNTGVCFFLRQEKKVPRNKA